MPAGECRTAEWAMYLPTGSRMSGSAGWSSTVNIRSLKNVRNASCSHGAGDAPPWQAEKTAIFMQRIHSVGRRSNKMGGVNQTTGVNQIAESDHAAASRGRKPVTGMDSVRRSVWTGDPEEMEHPPGLLCGHAASARLSERGRQTSRAEAAQRGTHTPGVKRA